MANENIRTKAMFVLENTAQNRAFLAMFKAMFNNARYKIKVRGRHSDRKAMFKKHKITANRTNDISVKYAEKIAVYVKAKNLRIRFN